jgi:GNAT superfamily N-acetyltransferase
MKIRIAQMTDVPAIAKVHVDSWRSAYQNIIPADFLANLSYKQRERQWHNILSNPEANGSVYVAEEENQQLVGFVSAGQERSGYPFYRGEIYAIYLLEAHQRQGIGRKLMITSVQQLLDAGLRSLLVWVLADNPACKFYAVLGGQPIDQKTEVIGGKPLLEVCYGWDNAGMMIAQGA